MSALDKVKAAKRDLDTANAALVSTVKDAIKSALDTAFEDDVVQAIAFGVSTDPYNDENAGQGIYGPFRIEPEYEDDFTRSEAHGVLYDRIGDRPASLHDLSEVLKVADWKYAGEALGVSYYEGEGSGQEIVFVARRLEQPTLDGQTYTLTEYDQSY